MGLFTALFIFFAIVLSISRIEPRRTDNYTNLTNRREALLHAGRFLAPYNDITRDLKLSNNYCNLKLGRDGLSIMGSEKKSSPNEPYRMFKVTSAGNLTNPELWDMFCVTFNINTNYDILVGLCNYYSAEIYEETINPKPINQTPITPKQVTENVKKIDVNNCSESELTDLPGVSIVLSKKIIKKREDIGGFKSVEDFLTFVKLNPNITEQLAQRICVNEMKGSFKIEKSNEREVDL